MVWSFGTELWYLKDAKLRGELYVSDRGGFILTGIVGDVSFGVVGQVFPSVWKFSVSFECGFILSGELD